MRRTHPHSQTSLLKENKGKRRKSLRGKARKAAQQQRNDRIPPDSIKKCPNQVRGFSILQIVPEWNEMITFLKEEEAKNVLLKYCTANEIERYDGEPIEDVIERGNILTLNLRRKRIRECKEDMREKLSLLDEIYQEERKKDKDKWPTKWTKIFLRNLGRIRFNNRWMQESFKRLLEQYYFLDEQINKQTDLLKKTFRDCTL